MTARIGKRQKQMLAWLHRQGGVGHIGPATSATHEISGWMLGEAVSVLKSLNRRGLIDCSAKGRGWARLTESGRKAAKKAREEISGEHEKYLSRFSDEEPEA